MYNPRGSRGRGRGQGQGHRRGMRETTRENKPIQITSYECPTDANGEPVTVPMRFEVIKKDGAKDEEIRLLQDFYLNTLKVTARNCSVEIDEGLEVRVTPVEGMGHARWVVHFKVSCVDWQTVLTLFTREFLASVWDNLIDPADPEWKINRSEMPILYTHSQLIYPLRLINMHRDIPFRRIKFGSFINSGLIGIHWNVEGGRATESDEKDGFTFYKDIDGSFEYDRRQLTLFFHNREAHPEDENDEPFLANYKITINMGSIRKIGLDQVEQKDGMIRRSLVLHVDYAPKIQVKLRNVRNGTSSQGNHLNRPNCGYSPRSHQGQYGSPNQNAEMSWSKFEHRLQIKRGIYPGESSHITALHQSKLIILELDNDHLNEKLVPASSSSIDRFIFDMISRLSHKTRKAVEFTSYSQKKQLEGTHREYYRNEYEEECFELHYVHPYEVIREIDDYVNGMIEDASKRILRVDSSTFHQLQSKPRLKLKMFRLRALLEGILQRGMDIRCQLLGNKDTWYSFVELVCDKYASNEQMTLHVMESLLSIISEGRPHCTVEALFIKEWKDSILSNRRTTVFTEEEKKAGYTRVMKFVQTPTRLIFVGYETIMENRVLKQHSKNGTEIIRVSFRDDSGEYMRDMSCGKRIIDATMQRVLMNGGGIQFGGRRYVWLGNSNSQLRDHGIYCYHEEREKVDPRKGNRPMPITHLHHKTAREIRKKLGHFDRLTSIPKWLARQGQCFTQARASSNMLSTREVGVCPDFIGGITDKLKPYCFSDGVGTISLSLADKLSKEHSLPRIASAFQIRHKGQKGLVAVDPTIDDRNNLAEMMGNTDEKTLVFVRPSMDKFEVEEAGAENMDKTNLEIVKYSMASPLFLNRPLLNILSQVSEDQSLDCYNRMKNRVEELLDIQVRSTMQSLYIEHKARDIIKEMCFPFAMEVFNDACPLQLTTEPFCRSMLTANARYVMHRQNAKMQIRIPSTCGRSMFGVIDDRGILQYGQIFCQYSSSTSKHMARNRSRRDGADGAVILTGPVMITKNPCIEKGDVRRFEAIDVPSLRHLVDVVVFPKHGPRPHPDEMAGSDLDGDEYSLIWDAQMLFDHNEEASLFPSGEDLVNWPIVLNSDGSVNHEECERKLAEFYIEAVTQEQIGVLSNAHLATSDFYGLENKASRSLARKISQSLDFQKNGIKPAKMSTEQDEDSDDPDRIVPPEKAVRKPDYMEKMRDAGYESRGIMGNIYREIKKYQHAIDYGEDQIEMIVIDKTFDIPGWKKYEGPVRREMEAYNHGIRSLLEYYGIASEGEIMSGQILSIKNRISEKEADDMNLYNTNQVIEEKMKREVTTARTEFFKAFLSWETDLDQVSDKRRDVDKDSILCRIVRPSTVNVEFIRQKAAAAYNICYEMANQQLQNGEQSSMILSFPWVVYDVLADIKLRPDARIVRVLPDEGKEQSNEPLAIVLSEFIDKYCQENGPNAEEYEQFKRKFDPSSIIGKSMNENEGVARACFVLVRWARHIGGMEGNSKFKENHLVALFILFGLGDVKVRGTRRRYIQRPTGEPREHLKKGEHLLKFIDYLSSREFNIRTSLSFDDVLPDVLMRGEWRSFGELCIPSYLRLVTTHHLDLPLKEEPDTHALRVASILKEYEPRKMELPENVIRSKLEEVQRDLLKATGCTQIQLRQMGNTNEVFVSALGTSENFKKLERLVVSPAPPRQEASEKKHAKSIPELVYARLLRAASLASSPSL